MKDDDIIILKGGEIASILEGREAEIIDTVRRAYLAHGEGDSALPHSTFLRFPNDDRSRVIALPAYVGGGFSAAGIKWIASFPTNLERGIDRASAVIILNSTATGRPEAILEGSIISAKRTAASAALAASKLHGEAVTRVGLVGCGLIGFEILRFLCAVWPGIISLSILDLDASRAKQFARSCETAHPGLETSIAPDMNSLLASAPLIVFATTAGTPHISDISACARGTTLLHISLRDLAADVILANDNVVDDVDHVSRAQTSVHLAELASGSRDFVRCTLADVLAGRAAARKSADGITIFSPFGLGVLDIALSTLVVKIGTEEKLGTTISSFLPEPWTTARK